jgi:hypothetical protein
MTKQDRIALLTCCCIIAMTMWCSLVVYLATLIHSDAFTVGTCYIQQPNASVGRDVEIYANVSFVSSNPFFKPSDPVDTVTLLLCHDINYHGKIPQDCYETQLHNQIDKCVSRYNGTKCYYQHEPKRILYESKFKKESNLVGSIFLIVSFIVGICGICIGLSVAVDCLD